MIPGHGKTMSAPKVFDTLAERIESDIRTRAQERTDEALAQAREVAFRAYATAFRPVCGIPFEVFIGDVLAVAEKSIRAAALVQVERNETAAVLRRLSAPVEGSA